MWGWVSRLWGGKGHEEAGGETADRRSARYDAALTTKENAKHWSWADALGPAASTGPADRRLLRNRARYETANNCFAKGLVVTGAHHLVGAGPTLQVQLDDQDANQQIEQAYHAWARAIRYARKLRVMAMAKRVDGETFGLHVTNPQLPHSVKLDLRVIEAEQVTTPGITFPTPQHVDGIEFDEHGNPTLYHVLENHPGDFGFYLREFKPVPARQVVHWFRATRPGMPRGISELTPALNLLPCLRRFTLATVGAAETAADFAAVLKTTGAANPDDLPKNAKQYSEMEIVRRMMAFLPPGYEMQQFKAEHPGTTYDMFVWALAREIARSLNMPVTVALLDSSKSNFSASRLDHMVWRDDVDVDREDCTLEVLEPTLQAWYDEAIRIPKLLPRGAPTSADALPHAWHWPPWPYLDPLVDRQAITEGLDNGSVSMQEVAAQEGKDWRQLITERLEAEAWEQAERKRLGLPPKPVKGKGKKGKKSGGDDDGGRLEGSDADALAHAA